jgi:hypothetical protein
MASPPRRMTRARARKEGYEPDWRINPHWKTPRKPKTKETRFALPENTEEDPNSIDQSAVGEIVRRPPSPVKIRIAAKLPPQLPVVETYLTGMPPTSGTKTTLELPPETSPKKSVNIGSPVRVRPRSEIVYNAADKENSPSAAILAKWASTGKSSTIPKTPAQSSRTRPLEASPSNFNTHPHAHIVKVLSTPVRIANPQTPGRNLGTARRIPVKVEKTKPIAYKLDPTNNITCPDSHRDFSYRVHHQSTTFGKPAQPIQRPVSPLKTQHPSPLSQRKVSKTLDVLQLGDMGLSDSIQTQSPQPKSWIPLKPGPRFQRPIYDSSTTSTRPAKTPTLNHIPARPATKRDFYVDEILSVPLQDDPKPLQRASTPVPKFPIRRRSVSQSSSLSGKTISTPRLISNPMHFDSLEELKPIIKTEKWRTPMKGSFQVPVQSVRKVCFRTPSMETPENGSNTVHTLGRSFSILSLGTPEPTPTPEGSTTPIDPPQCPSSSSPKVFDLSDGEDSFQLFTPRKPRPSSLPQLAYGVQRTPALFPEQDPPIQTPLIRDVELEIVVSKDAPVSPIQPQQHVPPPATLNIPKGSARRSANQRDFSVLLKPAHLETPLRPSKPQSTISPVKSNRSEKDAPGPLNGVIAFVDVKTADGDDAGAPFAETLKSLGAKVVKQWTWNGEELDKVGITHVIFKQGGPRTLSKVKIAKGLVKCVGLGWISRSFFLVNCVLITRCEAALERVDETLYQVEIPTGQYGHKVTTYWYLNG